MLRVLEVNVDDHLYGGVYVLVKNIIANLPSDITVDIAALEPFDKVEHIKEFESYGARVHYVGSNKNKLFKQVDIYRNVKRIVEQNQYDVVHFHSDVSHKILVSALAARNVKRLIFHSHANDADGNYIKLRRFFHKVCCMFLKKIPAIYIATSLEAGKWMFPWKKTEDIIILDNGIDYMRYQYNEDKREKKRAELGVDQGDFLIGFFARVVSQKNPFYAIKILEAISEKDKDTKLLCIGEGPLKQSFITELEKRKLIDYVIFIGNTDRIEDYYQAIDVLIMPSKFEGFGLVAVESQISGTPTLVSNKVPEKTKISDLIHYLPIQDEAVYQWCEALIEAKRHIKHNVIDEIDNRYEIHTLVRKIVEIYNR